MTRGIWDRETVALLLVAAALPVAVMWLQAEGLNAIRRLLFFLVFAGLWHVLFMLVRAQPPSFAGAVTALALAILAPENLGIVPLLIGTSFGVVMAELVFGGWGRNVLNPATVALSFLGFGFPASVWPDIATPVGWAAIAMAFVGVITGIMSLAIIAGAVIAYGAASMLGADLARFDVVFGLVLVMIVCDPVASASTSLGRILYGALFGGLTAVFAVNWSGAAPVQITIAAALLASIAAPLFDEIAIALWLLRRRKRLG